MANNFEEGNSIAPPRSVPPGGKRQRPQQPKLQIPTSPSPSFISMLAPVGGPRNHVPESPIMILTPEAPSPTPMAMRPRVVIPETATAFGDHRKPSPYPHDNFLLEQYRFFGSRHQPLTPIVNSNGSDRTSSRYYWKPSNTLLNTPYEFTWEPEPDTPIGASTNVLGPLTPFPGAALRDRTILPTNGNTSLRHISEEKLDRPQKSQNANQLERSLRQNKSGQPEKSVRLEGSTASKRPDTSPKISRQPPPNSGTPVKAELAQKPADSSKSSQKAASPASPKFHSASRSISTSRNGAKSPHYNDNITTKEADGSSITRNRSAADLRPSDSRPWQESGKSSYHTHHGRPGSPKSRNASRSGRLTGENVLNIWDIDQSNTSGTPTVTPPDPSEIANGTAASRPPSRRPSKVGDTSDNPRPPSRTAHHVKDGSEVRQRSDSIVQATIDQKGNNPVEAILNRLGMHTQILGGNQDDARPASRGRQRAPITEGPEAAQGSAQPRRLSQVQARDGAQTVTRHVSITRLQSVSRLADVRMATLDDEIVAIEEYCDPTCQLHSRRAASAGAVSHNIPSIANGRAILGLIANLPPPPPVDPQLTDDENSDCGEVITFKGPSVLGGRVRTTIVTAPPSGGSGVSVLTPPLFSAVSASSGFSAFTSMTLATPVAETPVLLNLTPAELFEMSLTPRGMTGTPKPMLLKLSNYARNDAPYAPLTCNHHGNMGQQQAMKIEALVPVEIGSRPRSW